MYDRYDSYAYIYNIYYMDDIIVMIYTIVFDRYARYGT